MSLSIPTTSSPGDAKCRTASEPIRPADPVTRATVTKTPGVGGVSPRESSGGSGPDINEASPLRAARPTVVLVGKGGVEPPRPFGHTDLNRARLPFRHFPRSGTPGGARGTISPCLGSPRRGSLAAPAKSNTSPADRCACRCAAYGYHLFSEPEEEPVSVLQRFEKRLEGLVEGAFAKVFKGVVHPVEILNAMQREAEAHKAILAGGRTLVRSRS